MKKTVLLIGPLLMFLSMGGCSDKAGSLEGSAQKPSVPVQTQKAERRDLTRRAIYTGSIEPVRVARMASPAEGPIVVCAVREGDQVRAGQLLVRVGRSQMAASGLDAAQAEWQRQNADFKRVEQLVKSGALAGEQTDIARASLKRAEAQVSAAQTSAGDYDIKAPWAGVISKVWISEGNYVAPRALLMELYDPTSLRVRFSVPEQDGRLIAVGTIAQVAIDAYSGQVVSARIERIYPQLEPTTRTFTIEAKLNADMALFSGMFARVEVPIETVTDAVVMPNGGLLALPNGDLVAFVAQNGKAARRQVKIGLEAGDRTQILEGISPGEDIIVQGQENLRDGASVKIAGPQIRPSSSTDQKAQTP